MLLLRASRGQGEETVNAFPSLTSYPVLFYTQPFSLFFPPQTPNTLKTVSLIQGSQLWAKPHVWVSLPDLQIACHSVGNEDQANCFSLHFCACSFAVSDCSLHFSILDFLKQGFEHREPRSLLSTGSLFLSRCSADFTCAALRQTRGRSRTWTLGEDL